MEVVQDVLGIVLEVRYLYLIAFIAFLYYSLFWESRQDRLLRKIPRGIQLPLLGHAWKFHNPESVLPVLRAWHLKYGHRVLCCVGNQFKIVLLSDPKDMQKVTSSREIITKSRTYDFLQVWLGTGLLFSTGEKWHSRRKLITPAFHSKVLEGFQSTFDETSKTFVRLIREKHLKTQGCEVQSLLARLTLEIICQTAMGKELNCQNDVNDPFMKATLRENELIWARSTQPWLHPNFLWKLSSKGREEEHNRRILHSFTRQVIEERKRIVFNQRASSSDAEDVDNGNLYMSAKRKIAFLDLLLLAQAEGGTKAITDSGIQEEVDTFMFEGHDTSASALSWRLFLLGHHPEHQGKVQEELDRIFGPNKEGPVVSSDLPKLKFLEMCIKETMRLFPPVPLYGRTVEKDYYLDEATIIPQGTVLMLNLHAAHRNPQVFSDPDKFQPERFLAKQAALRPAHAFLPFSAGPRNCIGQKFALAEMKTVLANILRNFTIVSLDTQSEVKPTLEIILRSKSGIRIRFEERKFGIHYGRIRLDLNDA